MSEKKEFQFNYSKYKTKKIDIKMLDNLMGSIVDAGTSKIAMIFAGIKIFLFFAYLAARKSLINEQFQIEKQEYEQNRGSQNDDILDGDDLD